jgi:hypothetical protein
MALTPSKSTQYTKTSNTPKESVPSSDWGSKLRASIGEWTFTAAGTGTGQMIKLPAGKVRVLGGLSRVIQTNAGSATSDLHVGNAAFTKADGTAGAADDNSLADDLDAGAAINSALEAASKKYVEFDSADGVDIEVMYDTANSPAAGTLTVILVYQMGN